MLLLAVVVLALVPRGAQACPTCACGNPALTSMGAEQPFANRVRLAATLRAWQQDLGTPRLDALRLRELRLDLSASWALSRWLSLTVNLPLQLRELQTVSLSRELGWGWGEVELGARAVVFGADRLRPPVLLSVLAGARFPSAPTLLDAGRQPLSLDGQLGAGGLTPVLGLGYSGFFSEQWSAQALLVGEWPATGRFGFRLGPSATLVALGQFQPLTWFGVRAGLDLRLEGASFLQQEVDTSLAGFLGSLLADVVFAVPPGLVLLVGARIPVLELRGRPSHTWPIVLVSAVVDL